MSRTVKYTCGTVQPSGCVLFTGELPAFVPETSLPCDASLDEVLERVFAQTEALRASTDLSALNLRCYPAPATVKAFAQDTIDKVCALSDKLTALEALVVNPAIGGKSVTVDLKCLKPAAAPCALGTDTYTLSAVLNVLIHEICAIKSHLNL